jgi:hypothetical protein
LEFDGLDCRWENNVDWDTLNPQVDNSDEGYDVEEDRVSTILLQEQRILQRVNNYVHVSQSEIDCNETEVEIETNYNEKRMKLVHHFSVAYSKGLVSWPRGFTEEKKKCYNLSKTSI